MSYKIGSLFDGSGGFPLAGAMCGFVPTWAAEVEPYPIAVTRSRFPNMRHLGDVSKCNGADIEPVDIICGGPPCQDLSVAGKRCGLKHIENGDEETTRSGLFMEMVRIIKEMRNETNGEYPTFVIWENVPGAFSSNNGNDFRLVLEEFIKIAEPQAVMPAVPKGGWAYADCYCGDGWSLAYRVFDAQYWGVPQRRRRIHLVLDLRGERAGKILFEREGLRGYFTEGRTPWQAIAADAQGRAPADDRAGEIAGCNGKGRNDKSSYTLNTIDRHAVAYGIDRAITTGGNCTAQGPCVYENVCGTMKYSGVHAVAYREGGFADYVDGVCGTLRSSGGAISGGSENLIVENATHYIVRRLTPTECARLQGFPDKWGHPDYKDSFTDEEYRFWLGVRNTHAEINGKAVKDYTRDQMLTWYNKLHTDSAEYKMWGNGIALPPALYCMQGIQDEFEGMETK